MVNVIEEFVQGLVKKAGLENTPEDFRNEYVKKLTAEVQRRLGIMAVQELDEQGLKDFEKLAKDKTAPKPNQIMDFFNARIPDFQVKLVKVLEDFGNEFVQGAEKLKGAKLS